MNYLKSELYRILHSKGIYILTGICTVLMLAMNILLFALKQYDNTFAYADTSFAFEMVEGSITMVFILTLIIGIMTFADEFKNGTIINSISFNGSRHKLYFAKLMSSFIISIVVLAVAIGIFTASAYLLLENSGIEALQNMLRGLLANIPNLLAGEVGAITLAFILKSSMAGTWSWIGIFLGVPAISSMLAMKFEFFNKLNGWLVYNVTGEGVPDPVNESLNVMLYMTNDGLVRCLLAGVIGIAVFVIIGVLALRKKEI